MYFIRSLGALIGRICISLIFILSAIHKIFNWEETERGLSNMVCDLSSFASETEVIKDFFVGFLSWVPAFMVLSIIIELIGGLMLFFNVKGRAGALFLLLLLLATTLMFHQFWFLEGFRREMELVLFLKNIAIAGGLLYILTFGCRIEREKPNGAEPVEFEKEDFS